MIEGSLDPYVTAIVPLTFVVSPVSSSTKQMYRDRNVLLRRLNRFDTYIFLFFPAISKGCDQSGSSFASKARPDS